MAGYDPNKTYKKVRRKNPKTGKMEWVLVGTPKPKKPPVNPLDAAVNSAISGMASPWQAAIKNVGGQVDYLQGLGDRTGQGLQHQMGQLAAEGMRNSDQMLASAAQASGASGAALQRQIDFLKSVAGEADPNAVNAGAASAGALNTFGHRNVASELMLRQGTQQNDDRMRAEDAALMNAEWQRGAMQPLAAQRGSMEAQIAAIKAQAPALKRAWGNEDREFGLQKDEMAFQRQQFAQAIKQWNSEFNAGREDALTADANTDAALQAQIDASEASATAGSKPKPGDDWRTKVGTAVGNATTLFANAAADGVAYKKLYQSFPSGALPFKSVDPDGKAGPMPPTRVLDLAAWRKQPVGTKVPTMFNLFKSQGMPPGWAFIAAIQSLPGAKEALLKAASPAKGAQGYVFDATSGQMRALRRGEALPMYYNTLRTY